MKMNEQSCPRQIGFEGVLNFRDLGGYCTIGGRTVAWRRLFRSSELHHMTSHDIVKLKDEIRLRSVIDLRSSRQLEASSPLYEVGVEYYNIPLLDSGDDQEDVYQAFSHMRDIYLYFAGHGKFGRRIVEALEIVAERDNLPLVFHCSAGKDRTGILAAIVLGTLGVTDEDIIADYTLSSPHIRELISRWENDPKAAEYLRKVPEYLWETSSESMMFFLCTLKREYGSVRGYVEAHGGTVSLIHRLETTLLG